MVDGRRGPQVLALQLLEPVPSVSRARRAKPEEMAGMVEDLIRLLDDASNGLRQGRYPDRGHSQKIATVMRAVADQFEACDDITDHHHTPPPRPAQAACH